MRKSHRLDAGSLDVFVDLVALNKLRVDIFLLDVLIDFQRVCLLALRLQQLAGLQTEDRRQTVVGAVLSFVISLVSSLLEFTYSLVDLSETVSSSRCATII